ncbi:ribosomal protein RPS6, partial [Cardiosporidium cionae]
PQSFKFFCYLFSEILHSSSVCLRTFDSGVIALCYFFALIRYIRIILTYCSASSLFPPFPTSKDFGFLIQLKKNYHFHLSLLSDWTGLQKQIEIDEEIKLFPFYEKRIGAEVPGDSLGKDYVGTIFRIAGGSDKSGFPMMQGIITSGRVRLLFRDMPPRNRARGLHLTGNAVTGAKNPSPSAALAAAKSRQASACLHRTKHFRPQKQGQMKRKSIRGCIVGPDLAVLNLCLTKKGPQTIEGITDSSLPRRLGPKRASNIRKLFNLDKKDDVRQYVIKRKVLRGDKVKEKAPKIQRLITATRLQRKRRERAIVKKRIGITKKNEKEYFEKFGKAKVLAKI